MVVSEHVLAELESTLIKPYFSTKIPIEQKARFFNLIRTYAEVIPLTIAVSGTATHPEDDLILATAMSASVDYLVTGDRQLLALEHVDRSRS
jgi:putative PIN family toxin of toxin-antitoxin system